MRWLATVMTALLVAAPGCGKSTKPVAPAAQEVPKPRPLYPWDTDPSWSADGARIAYSHGQTTPEETAKYGGAQIWSYDVATGAKSYLTSGWQALWSPDGNAVLVIRPSGLFIVSLRDSSEKQITQEEEASACWSPDGLHLAFSTIGSPSSPEGIYVIGADGSGMVEVASPGREPSWSPDGTKIVFDRYVHDLGAELFTMSPDGQNLVSLTSDPGNHYDPVWSHDGKYIAWDDGGSSIWTMNADGTGIQKIHDLAGEPSWSSDGFQIACTVPELRFPFGYYLAVMSRDGSNLRKLTGLLNGGP
jgi:Tol biopolymer transport system component